MISAIVLAAGKSTRMGNKNKMLLPFHGTTILGKVLTELEDSMAGEIIVVTDNNNILADNLSVVSKKTSYVTNPHADAGLTTSIQCGVKASSAKSRGFMICLGDMPLLTYKDYNLLINKFLDKDNQVILMPSYENKRGNPVIFSHHFLDQIMRIESMSGCKPIVMANKDHVIEVPFSNNNCHQDIDTVADYKKLTDQ